MYLILLGLPGAGKGTQAAMLAEETGLAHVTTGELFRENVRNGTELGREVQPIMEQGLLVPNELTIRILLERVHRPDAEAGFVLDGFPRNFEQASALDEALAAEGKSIDKAIHVRVSTEELVRRLSGRLNCRQCGAVYHETNRPPKASGVCDVCGGQLYMRDDDRSEVVRTRLEVNLKELGPLLEYYGRQGKLDEVDGEIDAERVKEALLGVIGRRQGVH